MYYNYILITSKNTLYKGLTQNLEERLHSHDLGEVRSTKPYRPLKLIHVELTSNREEARKLEKYFKSGFGRENIKEIIEDRVLAGVMEWQTCKT